MNEPLVSIVVPVYNTDEHMLEKCFDSILQQTYTNIELIIIDDGSKPETADWLDEYNRIHEDIIVIHNQNGGASVARNTGIGIAKGDYITFVDADDWVEPDFINALLKGFDDEIDIVMCTRQFEFFTHSKENHFFDKDALFDSGNKKELISKSITTGVAGTWCKMYRISFIRDNKLSYDPKLRRTQDIIFNLYAFQKAGRIRYLDLCNYHYRMQNESVTKKCNPKAIEILTPAAYEFSNFVNQYYMEDKEIRGHMYHKCINILNEICKLQVFNSKYSVSRSRRYELIRNLLDEPIYREAVNNYTVNQYPSILGKIKLLLLKKQHFFVLFQVYKLQMYAESRRNY